MVVLDKGVYFVRQHIPVQVGPIDSSADVKVAADLLLGRQIGQLADQVYAPLQHRDGIRLVLGEQQAQALNNADNNAGRAAQTCFAVVGAVAGKLRVVQGILVRDEVTGEHEFQVDASGVLKFVKIFQCPQYGVLDKCITFALDLCNPRLFSPSHNSCVLPSLSNLKRPHSDPRLLRGLVLGAETVEAAVNSQGETAVALLQHPVAAGHEHLS